MPGSCDLLDGGFLAHYKKKRWTSRDNENQVGEWMGEVVRHVSVLFLSDYSVKYYLVGID